MSAMDNLAALREMAGLDKRATVMDRLRSDFRAEFDHLRRIGELSREEWQRQFSEAGEAIKSHQADDEWIAAAAAHFRQMVERIERQEARSRAIAAEVRATKEAA